ncbi:hypothetical protein Goshw_009577, partial [Gossypium schwendimanii]|nr:hypothetical protein [Gossypium schwendimanii]
MDLDQVQNGVPWTFNNHLLVIHHMVDGQNPLKILLIHVYFWVQVHDLPPSFFSKHIAKQLGEFVGEFLEYDTKNLERGLNNYMQIRVKMDVRRQLRRKKKLMYALGKCSMVKGLEIAEMGWDLSIQAQSRRVMTISSRWLRREGVGGINDDRVERFDPILGLNLERDLNFMEDVKGDSSKVRGQMKMEHGSEDCPIEGGNGKKRPSRIRGNCNGSFVVDSLGGRDGTLLARCNTSYPCSSLKQ